MLATKKLAEAPLLPSKSSCLETWANANITNTEQESFPKSAHWVSTWPSFSFPFTTSPPSVYSLYCLLMCQSAIPTLFFFFFWHRRKLLNQMWGGYYSKPTKQQLQSRAELTETPECFSLLWDAHEAQLTLSKEAAPSPPALGSPDQLYICSTAWSGERGPELWPVFQKSHCRHRPHSGITVSFCEPGWILKHSQSWTETTLRWSDQPLPSRGAP